jgi:hypothetical protein
MSSFVQPKATKRVSGLEHVSQHKTLKSSSTNALTKSSVPVNSLKDFMLEGDAGTYATFEACEKDAISAIKSNDQAAFSHIILQSPSPWSSRLGVLFAAQLNWCDALRALLQECQTFQFPPNKDEMDSLRSHPLVNAYFRQEDFHHGSNVHSKSLYEERAFLKAVARGSYQVVRVFLEFIDPNFGDMFDKPLIEYIYFNKDKGTRLKCLQALLPRLEVSDYTLNVAAKNGDLPSVEYFLDKMKGSDKFLFVLAIDDAIKRGHDEVAKKIITEPGITIPWKRHTGGILYSIATVQNYDMLVFLSKHVPESTKYEPGFLVAQALWKFLKDKDRALYAKFVRRYPNGEGLSL